MRRDIQASLDQGQLSMVGEVGLDGSARMRWPVEARYLFKDNIPHSGKTGRKEEEEEGVEGEGEEDWKRLTPFKISMTHQIAIMEKQLELAIELGVNVSFHSVAAAGGPLAAFWLSRASITGLCVSTLMDSIGPTYDILFSMRKKHGRRFTDRVNVDIHSAGGWSAEFWSQAEVS